MKLQEEQLADRRSAILQAAERVFETEGYAQATMDAVAKEAQLAKGSIYNYFHNKEDLFIQVVAHAQAEDEAQADGLVSSALPASARLCRLLDDWFAGLAHHKRIGRLLLESWAAAARDREGGAISQMIDQILARWRDRISAIIAQGRQSGEFRPEVDPRMAAYLMMAVGDGATLLTVLASGDAINEEFLAAYKQSMLAVLTGKFPPEASDVQQE